eukprot:Pgem_evm1s19770
MYCQIFTVAALALGSSSVAQADYTIALYASTDCTGVITDLSDILKYGCDESLEVTEEDNSIRVKVYENSNCTGDIQDNLVYEIGKCNRGDSSNSFMLSRANSAPSNS